MDVTRGGASTIGYRGKVGYDICYRNMGTKTTKRGIGTG